MELMESVPFTSSRKKYEKTSAHKWAQMVDKDHHSTKLKMIH